MIRAVRDQPLRHPLEPIESRREVVEARVDSAPLSRSASAARASRSVRATKVDVMAAVMMARKAVPSSITSEARSLPAASAGVTLRSRPWSRFAAEPHPGPDVGVLGAVEEAEQVPAPTTTTSVAADDHARGHPQPGRLAQEVPQPPVERVRRSRLGGRIPVRVATPWRSRSHGTSASAGGDAGSRTRASTNAVSASLVM